MSIDVFDPPSGEFPAEAFTRRRAHLLREFGRNRPQRRLLGDLRRRPLLALAVLVALVALPVSALAVTGAIPLKDWPFYRGWASGMEPANRKSVVIVTSGSFDGQQWVLAAFRSTSDSLCDGIVEMSHGLPSSGAGLGCGSATPTISPSFGGDGKPDSPFIAYGSVARNVATVEIRLANGSVSRIATVPAPAGLGIPVRFYAVQMRAVGCPSSSRLRLAARITAYDGLNSRGTVIVTRTVPSPAPGVPLDYRCPTQGTFFSERPTQHLTPTGPLRSLHRVLRVTGPFGATATLSVGPTVTTKPATTVRTPRGRLVHIPAVRARCWRVVFSRGAPESDCQSSILRGGSVSVLGVQPSGRDVFIVAQTLPGIEHVRILFSNGDTIDATPNGGVVLVAIPRAQLTQSAQRATLTALDRAGVKVGFNTWAYYRMRPSDLQPEPQ